MMQEHVVNEIECMGEGLVTGGASVTMGGLDIDIACFFSEEERLGAGNTHESLSMVEISVGVESLEVREECVDTFLTNDLVSMVSGNMAVKSKTIEKEHVGTVLTSDLVSMTSNMVVVISLTSEERLVGTVLTTEHRLMMILNMMIKSKGIEEEHSRTVGATVNGSMSRILVHLKRNLAVEQSLALFALEALLVMKFEVSLKIAGQLESRSTLSTAMHMNSLHVIKEDREAVTDFLAFSALELVCDMNMLLQGCLARKLRWAL